jgi:predicted ATPase
VLNPFKNETFSYSFLLRSRLKGFFNFEASYKNTQRSLKTAFTEKSLTNNLHKLSTIINIKSSEKLLFNFETNWVQLRKENTASATLTLVNMWAEYHVNKKVLLRLEGYNLLNSKTLSDATISPFYSQAQTQNILGAYGLISLEYRF